MAETAIATTPATTRDLDLFDAGQFAGAMKLAELLSTATGWVPRHLLGNPGACFGIVSLSKAWNVNPFLLAAATADIHGKLLFEAKAVQAGIERSGALDGNLEYQYVGDWSKVRGKFTMVESARKTDDNGQPSKYARPSWQPADEEGLAIIVSGTPRGSGKARTHTTYLKSCHPRNSTLWATNPEEQCRYRATRDFARACLPGMMLGAVTQDEYAGEVVIDVTPKAEAPAPESRLRAPRKAKEPAPAPATVEAAAPAPEPAKAPQNEVPYTPIAGLAAVEAVGVPRDALVRWLKGTDRMPAGLDHLSQQLLAAMVNTPHAIAAAVSAWTAEQDAAEAAAAESQASNE